MGLGARVCFKFEHPNGQCADQEPIPRPPPPPPPPPKRIIREDFVLVCPLTKKKLDSQTLISAIGILQEAENALETAMSVYHMGEGLVIEKDIEAAEKIKAAGGYLAYIIQTQRRTANMRKTLIKIEEK